MHFLNFLEKTRNTGFDWSGNQEIRKSGNPEILNRNPQPHILQWASLLSGRHEPEALKSAAPKGTDGVLNILGNPPESFRKVRDSFRTLRLMPPP